MDKENNHKEQAEDKELYPLLELARKMVLASIGAIALAQEEIEAIVKKLVERGEIAEKDGRELLKKAAEKSREMAKRSKKTSHEQMEEVLKTMDIPTRSDIKALSNKIAGLTKQIEELKKE